MRKADVQDLVSMFLQSCHLHTRNCIIQPLELAQPRRSSWMSGNRSIHIVITIEEIPPQKIVTRHSVPLPAGATSSEDILVLHVLEHFEENGVWQQGGAPAFHRIILSSCAPQPVAGPGRGGGGDGGADRASVAALPGLKLNVEAELSRLHCEERIGQPGGSWWNRPGPGNQSVNRRISRQTGESVGKPANN